MNGIANRIATRFLARTITRDLTLGLIFIISITLVVIGVLSYLVYSDQNEEDLMIQANQIAEKLANILSTPMWTLDMDTVRQIADAYQHAENVVEIQIQDEDNQIVFSTISNETQLIKTTRPIYYRDHQIGHVAISLSTHDLRLIQTNIFINTAVSVLLVVLVVMLATGLFLEFFLNRPLRRLVLGIEKVASGNYSYVLERAPQADIDEIVQRVNLMAAQISERIEALRRERDIISRIMQTSPVGITMLNQDHQIIFANSQARRIMGLISEETTQRPYNSARDWRSSTLGGNLFPDDNKLFLQVTTSAHPIYDVQHSLSLPSGKQILLSINAAPLFDDLAQVDGMVATIDDITERKLSEMKLRQRLAELETVQKISTVLRTAKTLDEMLPRLLDETLAVLDTTAGGIYLFDPNENVLNLVVARDWFEQAGASSLVPGDGPAGTTFVTGQTVFSKQMAHDPLMSPEIRAKIPLDWGGICVPIRSVDATLGVLLIALAHPREFSPENVHLLITLAEIAGNAFHRTSLHAQTEQRLQRLMALRTLDLAISANTNLHETLDILITQALTHLDVDAATVLLFNPQSQMLEYAAGRGFRTDLLTPTHLRLGQGLAGRAAHERKIIKILDWRSEAALSNYASLSNRLQVEGFTSYFGVPLIAKEQIKGVLEIFNRTRVVSDPEWLDFLTTLAGQAAIAIDDAQLLSNLQRSNSELALAYDTTLEGWSRALDLRDKETEGHTQRVATLAARLAQILGLSEEKTVQIRRGALLHDIGKMGIPDGILLKPGTLSDEEWEIMRKHPAYAYEMLFPISYLRASLDIPYCHHEKWDGSGYPRGLKGEEIPLAARIFAIVDVWDALTSDRPYRSAWSKEKALEFIYQQSGKNFDPQVVVIFTSMILDESQGL